MKNNSKLPITPSTSSGLRLRGYRSDSRRSRARSRDNYQLQTAILETLRYFSFFNYAPTGEEICTFLKKRCSKRQITSILEKMVKKSLITTISNTQIPNSLPYQQAGKYSKQISSSKPQKLKEKSVMRSLATSYYLPTTYSDNTPRYTLGEYKEKPNYQLPITNYQKRQRISEQKIERILPYVKLLALLPQIKLIGLSGSVAMLSADDDHDVDLFIITAKNRLFTGRFIALLLAQMFGIRRPRHPEFISGSDFTNYKLPITNYKDKVCLNLFFDESNMVIPKRKRSEYVAHEVLQMKFMVQREDTYLRFIDANKWVFDIFPNALENVKFQNSIRSTSSVLILSEVEGSNIKSNPKIKVQKFGFGTLNLICNLSFVIWIFNTIESLLKNVQLHFINKHKTTEIITDFQLWFHPDDFEKKLSNLYKIKSR